MQVSSSVSASSPTPSNFDMLFIVRLIFYIMVGVKLIEIAYMRKRKMNLRQRIYRKFIFAHNEVIKGFSQDERVAMESTLSNTIRNANMALPTMKNDRKSRNCKRVLFVTQSNEYYQPEKEQQNGRQRKAQRGLPELIKDDYFMNEKDAQIGAGNEERPLLAS